MADKHVTQMIILASIFSLCTNSHVYAAHISIRIEKPKTPTNQNMFDIVFAALDILNRPVTVKCKKQAPGEGGFTQFGTDISLPSGGSTGVCPVTSNIISAPGTYTFQVEAATDSEIVSDAATVEYKTDVPGNPADYSKERLSSCQYKLKCKGADDNGKTVSIEIYRSTDSSFTANSGSRIATIPASSNEEKEYIDSIPDCTKDFYYVIRAFDTAGNGSNLVGDSIVHVTVKTTTVTSTIPRTASQTSGAGQTKEEPMAGAIPFEETGSQTVESGAALGETVPATEVVPMDLSEAKGVVTTIRENAILVIGLIFFVVGLAFYGRYGKNRFY